MRHMSFGRSTIASSHKAEYTFILFNAPSLSDAIGSAPSPFNMSRVGCLTST